MTNAVAGGLFDTEIPNRITMWSLLRKGSSLVSFYIPLDIWWISLVASYIAWISAYCPVLRDRSDHVKKPLHVCLAGSSPRVSSILMVDVLKFEVLQYYKFLILG